MTILFFIITLACIIGFFYGLFLLVFKKGKRKFGGKISGWALFLFFVSTGIVGTIEVSKQQEQDAIVAGFSSHDELQTAAEYGVVDGVIWATQKDKLIAAKLETERLEKEQARQNAAEEMAQIERLEAEAAAAKAKLAAAAEAAKIAEKEEERRKGFHCLSGWDGSLPDFKSDVKDAMRDPDSFEHIETRVTAVDDAGMHTVRMQYRARNGFGGMNVGTALGKYANNGCQHMVISIE